MKTTKNKTMNKSTLRYSMMEWTCQKSIIVQNHSNPNRAKEYTVWKELGKFKIEISKGDYEDGRIRLDWAKSFTTSRDTLGEVVEFFESHGIDSDFLF